MITQTLSQTTSQETQQLFDSNYIVSGYATTFEPYEFYEDEGGIIYEKFDRNCFVGCDMSDIIMQYDHSGKVLARQSNKTLIVQPDDKGLFVCADLSKSNAAKDMFEEIQNGLITRMSWGFMPGKWYYDDTTRTIVHTQISKIFDVSSVSIPANQDTEIHARALFDGEINRMRQELSERELNKKKLNLKLKLMEVK